MTLGNFSSQIHRNSARMEELPWSCDFTNSFGAATDCNFQSDFGQSSGTVVTHRGPTLAVGSGPPEPSLLQHGKFV